MQYAPWTDVSAYTGLVRSRALARLGGHNCDMSTQRATKGDMCGRRKTTDSFSGRLSCPTSAYVHFESVCETCLASGRALAELPPRALHRAAPFRAFDETRSRA